MKDIVEFKPVVNLGTRPPPPLDISPIELERLPTMSIPEDQLNNINLEDLPTLDAELGTMPEQELMKTRPSSSNRLPSPMDTKARMPVRINIPQEASQLEMVPVGNSGFSMIPFDEVTTPLSFVEVMRERVPVINLESLEDLITDDPIQSGDIPDFMKTANFNGNDPAIADVFGNLEPEEDEERLVDVPEDISLTKDEMDLLNKMIVSDTLTETEMEQVKKILEVKMSAMQKIITREQPSEAKSLPENPPTPNKNAPVPVRMMPPTRKPARFHPNSTRFAPESTRFQSTPTRFGPTPTRMQTEPTRMAPNTIRMGQNPVKLQESDFNLPDSKGGDIASFPIILQLPKEDCPKYCINIKVEVTRLGRSLTTNCRNTPLCNNNRRYRR